MSQSKSEQLAQVYYDACMAELQALKPGNVHVFADGHGMTIQDFIKSAEVTAAIIAKPNLSVGERIFYAVEATQQAVGQNTNLGMILLCAPLIHAALHQATGQTLKQSLDETLSQLTVSDAQLTSQAIVLANPAGLGKVEAHDVHAPVNISLLAMMAAAQNQDRIAWQYANAFTDVLEFGVGRYCDAMVKWQNAAWATTALYLNFLTRNLDTHVIRKHGETLAKSVMLEAREIEMAHWTTENPKLVQKQLLDWDASLKSRGINPGTSADLTVASVLAVFLYL